MTRNEAISIMMKEVERAQSLSKGFVEEGPRKIYFAAYQDGVRNLIVELSARGAFEASRNTFDRMPSRREYKP